MIIKHTQITTYTKIFLTIFVFCLIYAPRFFTYNTLHILFGISILLSLLFCKEFVYVRRKTITFRFCIIYASIVLYSSIIAYLGGERLTLTDLVMVPVELGTCTILAISILLWAKLKSKDLINIIIICGIIQSLICCAMVLVPGFRDAINDFRSQYWDDRLMGWASVRLLGFADNLFHTTPIIQAIISVLIIKKAEKYPFLFIFVVTTLISAILNSRTSFIVWCMCIVYYYILRSENPINKRKNIIIFIICCLVIPSFLLVILDNNVIEAMEYFYSGLEEIESATQGKKVGFFESLSRFSVLPHDLDLLFGIGCNTYGEVNNIKYLGIRTDYGFFNDIWTYGIFGASFMTLLYIYTIWNCKNLKNCFSRLLVGCLIISFIIGHFKGIMTSYNDFTAFLLLLSSATILDYKKDNKILSSKNKI